MPIAEGSPAPAVVVMSSDWALRELLRLLLEDRDYDVLEASDAAGRVRHRGRDR